MVGAQRAPSFYDTDGPRNLLNAVRVAVSPEAKGMGTFVVMNGQIHAAREVTKTNTIARETFKTLEFGALGVANLAISKSFGNITFLALVFINYSLLCFSTLSWE